MRKIIAAMNMTLDGFCDHTSMIADDEIHQHYNDLLLSADTLVYGRTTYQLMESYWPTVVATPTGNKPTDDFALIIDNISKIVFSHTMKGVEWKNARVAKLGLAEEMAAVKKQPGKDILIGSPGLIAQAMNLGVVDEYQFLVQPIVAAGGLPLFKNISERVNLKLIKTKTFAASGSVVLYLQPTKK